MSSSNYETVYEHYDQESRVITTTETPVSSPPEKKLSRKEKIKAGLKKAASKTKEVAKKGVETAKKGGKAVVKGVKAAAAWTVFYFRLAMFVGFLLLAAYLYTTFMK
jgi:hypothetical protein